MKYHEMKELRKQVGLRSIEVARALDVTPETVSRWERGVTPISLVVEKTFMALVEDPARVNGILSSRRGRRISTRIEGNREVLAGALDCTGVTDMKPLSEIDKHPMTAVKLSESLPDFDKLAPGILLPTESIRVDESVPEGTIVIVDSWKLEVLGKIENIGVDPAKPGADLTVEVEIGHGRDVVEKINYIDEPSPIDPIEAEKLRKVLKTKFRFGGASKALSKMTDIQADKLEQFAFGISELSPGEYQKVIDIIRESEGAC
jgi:DNA-binding XRE family transcriptional regulator